jgi:2-polyprenyl-3-methyl-5-hydroxy-6-metoxy-1,4-benzoquinol methylase
MKRKSRIDLGDVKEKKLQTGKDEFLPLVSLTENPVVLVKNSENYRFGNYKKYYKLRHERKWNDPRIAVLDKSLFIQKTVLDIGCNDGTISLIIALR